MIKLEKTFENLETANLVKITFKLKRGDNFWEERNAFHKELAEASAGWVVIDYDAVGMHILLESGQKFTVKWEEEAIVTVDVSNNEVYFSIKKGIDARRDQCDKYQYDLEH